MASDSSNNRRRFQRILFDAAASIEVPSGEIPVSLIDVSLNGALIKCPDNWSGSIDDKVSLSVQLDAEEKFTLHMQTKLAHIEENHIGLHCEHIDIDSITSLRRLVELNLGNSDFLDRELAALG